MAGAASHALITRIAINGWWCVCCVAVSNVAHTGYKARCCQSNRAGAGLSQCMHASLSSIEDQAASPCALLRFSYIAGLPTTQNRH
jgi:hypothetical protein